MNWQLIEDIKVLDSIIELSQQKPLTIFKHSTRCGISSFVLKNFERSLPDELKSSNQLYYLDLIAYRNISKAIEERFDVRHESPQVIVIKKGEAIYNASHYGIDVDRLAGLLIEADSIDQI